MKNTNLAFCLKEITAVRMSRFRLWGLEPCTSCCTWNSETATYSRRGAAFNCSPNLPRVNGCIVWPQRVDSGKKFLLKASSQKHQTQLSLQVHSSIAVDMLHLLPVWNIFEGTSQHEQATCRVSVQCIHSFLCRSDTGLRNKLKMGSSTSLQCIHSFLCRSDTGLRSERDLASR
jgi:hypothetical protein